MTDATGTTTYSYNPNNWLTSIAKNGITQLTYSYDEIGNISSVVDYKGNITTYTYDKSSRMETVNYNIAGETGEYIYSYDENGNRIKEGINLLVVAYEYDKNNRLIAMTNHELYAVNFITHLIPKTTFKYTYDLAGRIITKTDDYGTTTYTYDEVGRIKQVETPGKTTIYSYDNVGNRTSQVETYTSDQPSGIYVNAQEIDYRIKNSQYIYSNTNTLLTLVESMKDISGTELLEKTITYTYDNNGNQLTEQTSYTSTLGQVDNNQENKTYEYDGFNRLTKVNNINTNKIVSYQYNGKNLRIKKKVEKNGQVTEEINYLYDRQYVILETDEQDKLQARYIIGINYIGSIDQGNKESFYVYNGHGDVVQTISPEWEILNQYDYDIFGNFTLEIETNPNAIRYAGEFYDVDTGLYYLRARFYNPYIGRFITEDSYWGADNNPLSLNLYTYAHNNPIMYIDPTGHYIADIDSNKRYYVPAKKTTTSKSSSVKIGNSTVSTNIVNGKTAGNLSDIAKGLGGSVGYDSKSKTTTVTLNGKTVSYDLKNLNNGVGVASDGSTFTLKNGKIQVGVRETAENAGANVNYSKGVTTVTVSKDSKKSGSGSNQPTTTYTNPNITYGNAVDIDEDIDPQTDKAHVVDTSNGNNMGNDGYEYVKLYDPAEEAKIEEDLVEEYSNADNGFEKAWAMTKIVGHNGAKIYGYAKAYFQKGAYENLGVDPEYSGAVHDVAYGYGIGSAVGAALSSVGKGINALKVKVIKPSTTKAVEVTSKTANKIDDLASKVKKWIGDGGRVKTNKNGDKVFISNDGTRRVRFDINNPSPHKNPHGHVEEIINGKWQKSGPIYPTDVPHN